MLKAPKIEDIKIYYEEIGTIQICASDKISEDEAREYIEKNATIENKGEGWSMVISESCPLHPESRTHYMFVRIKQITNSKI